MWLTFDWDDVTPNEEKVKNAFSDLNEMFGVGNVWYRISSSQTGLHIVIAEGNYSKETSSIYLTPKEFDEDEVMQFRKLFSYPPYELECNGRLVTDSLRRSGGTTWGRIFTVKNGNKSGEWLPC